MERDKGLSLRVTFFPHPCDSNLTYTRGKKQMCCLHMVLGGQCWKDKGGIEVEAQLCPS